MAKRTPDEEAYIKYENLKIPVSIYFENRRNTRISIGSESIHLRLSRNLSQAEFSDQINWAGKWLHRRFEKAPTLLERFKMVHFLNGDRIRVLNDIYILHLDEEDRKNSSATLNNHDIYVTLASGMDIAKRNKTIQSLCHKIICQKYLQYVKQRVHELNERFFREPYTAVKLKYIHSKWGSCSSDGEIILSSKLLFCPQWIFDYVIVHELAHLIEHNHSDSYWELVASAIPGYEKADKWLNNEGAGIELMPIKYDHQPVYPFMNKTITEPKSAPQKSDSTIEQIEHKEQKEQTEKAEQPDIVPPARLGEQLKLF